MITRTFSLADILRSPVSYIEGSEQHAKVARIPLPAQGCTCVDCDSIPPNVFQPRDAYQTLLAVRDLKQFKTQPMYKDAPREAVAKAEEIMNLVARCHNSLRLRESSFFLLCASMHRFLQRVDPFEPEMFKLLCALVFLVHKYEPTDGQVYRCDTMIERLFGKQTTVTVQQVLDYEEAVFELLDYSLAAVTPYDFVHLFADCAQLSPQQACLALYLCSLAVVSPSCQSSDPCRTAAAIVLLVLQKAGQGWNQSLLFWSGLRPAQFEAERRQVLQLWTDSFVGMQNGRQSFVVTKFKNARKYQVSLEEPAAE